MIEYSLRFGHKSIGRARDRLTDLGHEDNTAHGGRYLDKPAAQFPQLPGGYVPRNHTLIYSLGIAGKKALAQAGRLSPAPAKGWWEHQVMVACITASAELGVFANPGLGFIPRHEIIGHQPLAADVAFPYEGRSYVRKLIPDQLFAIQYGSKRLCFLVEADRGTEPGVSRSFDRKSFLRSVLQYRQFVGTGQYKRDYQIDEPIAVLFVTTVSRQIELMLEIVSSVTGGKSNTYLLFSAIGSGNPSYRTADPNPFDTACRRANAPPLFLLNAV